MPRRNPGAVVLRSSFGASRPRWLRGGARLPTHPSGSRRVREREHGGSRWRDRLIQLRRASIITRRVEIRYDASPETQLRRERSNWRASRTADSQSTDRRRSRPFRPGERRVLNRSRRSAVISPEDHSYPHAHTTDAGDHGNRARLARAHRRFEPRKGPGTGCAAVRVRGARGLARRRAREQLEAATHTSFDAAAAVEVVSRFVHVHPKRALHGSGR